MPSLSFNRSICSRLLWLFRRIWAALFWSGKQDLASGRWLSNWSANTCDFQLQLNISSITDDFRLPTYGHLIKFWWTLMDRNDFWKRDQISFVFLLHVVVCVKHPSVDRESPLHAQQYAVLTIRQETKAIYFFLKTRRSAPSTFSSVLSTLTAVKMSGHARSLSRHWFGRFVSLN